MENQSREQFQKQWNRYFPEAELPLFFYYTDEETVPAAPQPEKWKCVMADIFKVRKGEALRFDAAAIGCGGGRRYTGLKDNMRENFRYFLSCGIPGELEGERYKKSPALVDAYQKDFPFLPAGKKYFVCKRWDQLTDGETPTAVLFFAPPDVLSGLFTLANFDLQDQMGVITPFISGCGSIFEAVTRESERRDQRCILGMFDVSARPYVKENELSFAIPWERFIVMLNNMDESFLTTESWQKVQKRIRNAATR